MFALTKPVVSLLFPIPPTCAEPPFQRGSCDVTKGEPVLSRRLWSSLLKDHLWSTIGCRAKGTSHGFLYFLRPLHNEPHLIQKEPIANFSSTGTALPVLSSHHIHSYPQSPGSLFSLPSPSPIWSISSFKGCFQGVLPAIVWLHGIYMLAYFCVYCVFIFVLSLSVFSVIRFLKLVLGLIFEKLHDIGERTGIWNQKNLGLNPMLYWVSYLTSLCWVLSFIKWG